MKELCVKISIVLKKIFGWGIFVSLFSGGLTFFGYMAALIVGGSAAEAICAVIYEKVFPVIIYIATTTVLIGIAAMYFAGEKALTPETEKNMEDPGEF